MEMKQKIGWLMDWAEAVVAGPSVSGGKGWNLGRLHRYGFPVPEGCVLSVEGYNRLMSEPKLREMQTAISYVKAEEVTDPEIESKLAALRLAIESAELPEEMVEEVEQLM